MVDQETLEARWEEKGRIGNKTEPVLYSNAPRIKPASYVDEDFLEARGEERGRRLAYKK